MPARIFYDEQSGPGRVVVFRRDPVKKVVGSLVTLESEKIPTDLDRPVKSARLFDGELIHWECGCGVRSAYFVRAFSARKSLVKHWYRMHSPAAFRRLYGRRVDQGETFGDLP